MQGKGAWQKSRRKTSTAWTNPAVSEGHWICRGQDGDCVGHFTVSINREDRSLLSVRRAHKLRRIAADKNTNGSRSSVKVEAGSWLHSSTWPEFCFGCGGCWCFVCVWFLFGLACWFLFFSWHQWNDITWPQCHYAHMKLITVLASLAWISTASKYLHNDLVKAIEPLEQKKAVPDRKYCLPNPCARNRVAMWGWTMDLSQLLGLFVWNNLSCFACLLVWMCKDTFETIRIRAKPWNLLIWILQSAELGGTGRWTFTDWNGILLCILVCCCIGRLRLLEQLLGDACICICI